jgi:hypothetical protein
VLAGHACMLLASSMLLADRHLFSTEGMIVHGVGGNAFVFVLTIKLLLCCVPCCVPSVQALRRAV